MKQTTRIGLGVVLLLVLCMISIPVGASVDPNTVEFTLNPGETATESKDVCIPAVPAMADVLFSFDLTGSMGGILATAKTNGIDIITGLEGTGIDIQYGVSSHMDYPDSYDTCGYSATYGDDGTYGYNDYAYSLDQFITDDNSAVTTAINGLQTENGMDGPEDYTRVFYESYADTNTGWRTGAKKVMVHFGDNVPHDCNLEDGISGGTWTTGVDPGRDEIAGTGDDLDLQTVLGDMALNNVMLIECHTSTSYEAYWAHWVGITGGSLELTGSSGLVEDVIAAVTEGLTTPEVTNVHFEAESPFEDWIDSDWSYSGPTDECIDDIPIAFTVPEGTECGDYTFTVSVVDEAGVSYGEQEVTIHVPCVIPVYVDIKPGSCPNAFNTKQKGVTPVAILGTDEFDVKDIDPKTVRLNGIEPLRWSYQDVATPYTGTDNCCWEMGGDGYRDLVLHFDSQALAGTLSGYTVKGDPIDVTITGSTWCGASIEGTDCVWVVN